MRHQGPSFPQCKSSSNSMTTGFPLNQSGLASASSFAQGNSAESPYSMQTPDHRFSQQRLNLSGDDLPYGTVHDFWNDSTSSGTCIQHSAPEHSYQQFGYYNQSGKPLTTLQCGATCNIVTGTMSLQTDPTNYGLPAQNRPFYQIDPQDFSSTALDARQSLHHWDHMTIYSEDSQLGCLGQSQSDATSIQPDMRYKTSWQSPYHVSGQRSFNSTLCQPGPSSMGVGLSEVILQQPDIPVGTLAEAAQNDFDSTESHCPMTNDMIGFSHTSLMYEHPSSLQHPIHQPSMTESYQNWNASSAKAKDKDVIEDSDALEHVVGPNDMLCWNRSVPTTDGSMEECHYQHQQSLNTTQRHPEDIQDLTTLSSLPQETCTSEEVRHQVAFSHQQSPAASGLQPWVSAAPPVSMCVKQQGLSSFDTDATVALPDFPFHRSTTAGLGVVHSRGQGRDIEREASITSIPCTKLGNTSKAQFMNFQTGVSCVNFSTNNPEFVAVSSERKNVFDHEPYTIGEMDVMSNFSPGCSSALSHWTDTGTIHAGGWPSICPLCKRAFAHRSSLLRHLLSIHKGEKEHICPYCRKAFRDFYCLSRHERIHMGERPHTCQFCSKTFSDPSNLKTHERTHTGERPYSCLFCSETFLHPNNRTRHQRNYCKAKP